MGIYDFDDIEDIVLDEYVEEESNIYIAEPEKALELMGKILSQSKRERGGYKDVRRIDSILDVELLESLRRVQVQSEAALQLKLTRISDILANEKKYLALKGRPVVGIGGKFSAGKSRFINSLLDAEGLLPEDQDETTSIPTYIIQGEEKGIVAYTADNNTVLLDTESMQALTHRFKEKYKIGFSSFIDCLVVTTPDTPYKDIVFLDTPGYNKADSVDKNQSRRTISDEKKAREQLNGVDFLIWLVDIENGELGESDIGFIHTLGAEQPVLIVVNKADKRPLSDIEAITDKIRMTAEVSDINCAGVVAYSSREAKEYGAGGQIQSFLKMASGQRSSKEDVLVQFGAVERQIMADIEAKADDFGSERAELFNVLKDSGNIGDIKALVNVYGEVLGRIRDVAKGKNSFVKITKELKSLIRKRYKGGQ